MIEPLLNSEAEKGARPPGPFFHKLRGNMITTATPADQTAVLPHESNGPVSNTCVVEQMDGPTLQPISLARRRLRQGLPIVDPQGNRSPAYHRAKRLIDVVGAGVLLIVLGPIMLAVLLVLTATTRGKPLYRQRRSGYLGRPFWMFKFRTMRLDADRLRHTVANEHEGPIFKNRRDPRITRFGRFLRKTSLDETPQLFGVLFGEMSLVGPRPLPVSEVARFEPWHRSRLAVMPGLTCLWQVSGRSDVGFEDWMRLDIRYVRNQSLWTDCGLLLRTPLSVLSGRGAY